MEYQSLPVGDLPCLWTAQLNRGKMRSDAPVYARFATKNRLGINDVTTLRPNEHANAAEVVIRRMFSSLCECIQPDCLVYSMQPVQLTASSHDRVKVVDSGILPPLPVFRQPPYESGNLLFWVSY